MPVSSAHGPYHALRLLDLLCAICEWAAYDAAAGDVQAASWIAPLRQNQSWPLLVGRSGKHWSRSRVAPRSSPPRLVDA
jgi:hypothetical protein